RNDCRTWSPVTGADLSTPSGGGNPRTVGATEARPIWHGWTFPHTVREARELKTLACRGSVEIEVERREHVLARRRTRIERCRELYGVVATERMLFCEATGSEHESLAHLDDGIALPRRIELHRCAAQIGLREPPCTP